MRHGERADDIRSPTQSAAMNLILPRSQTLKCDPPLTKVGVAQAILTGQFLKEYFENKIKPNKIVIKTSPFIRCIMTACAIAG